ncbi:hypothetical protein [Saccharothrix sp.]|uniref:hypothetical protein n=1 Tax=Saccharothrix sp. TaxID=1873460 RepID=UPI0035C7F628
MRPSAFLNLFRDNKIRRVVVAAAVLGLATIGDGFVYLLLQKRENLAIGWFPLLTLGTSLVCLLLAAPLGALADRVGRLPVMLGGYVALAAAPSSTTVTSGPVTGPNSKSSATARFRRFRAPIRPARAS